MAIIKACFVMRVEGAVTMVKPVLRVIAEPDAFAGESGEATVSMTLKDIFPLLLHAHRHSYAWLKDMADDEVIVTRDLADILTEFASIVQQKRGA